MVIIIILIDELFSLNSRFNMHYKQGNSDEHLRHVTYDRAHLNNKISLRNIVWQTI